MNKIHIGTSGWNYYHWKGIFYPEDLKSQELLPYYTQHFDTVEINSSFYHLPREQTFINWYNKVPKNFLFSVKVWRRITHFKKLNKIENDLKIFWQRVLALKEKLGPLLFQFPPSFSAKGGSASGGKANLKKLDKFCQFLRKLVGKDQEASFEFRHQGWFIPEVYQILQKYNLALCWADTPDYPYKEVTTANYVYFRLHGHQKLYTSNYNLVQLKGYAEKIKKLIKNKKTVYCYFDNDTCGFAIKNALTLKNLLKN